MVINVDAEVATEKMRYLLNAKARLEEPIRIYGVTFPAFNESWSDPVKLAWFSAFSNLR
jgi:hypothetical protein